ncbi:BREX-2 system adenine-specific DNA-methyltransferase PglX [Actinoplanes solisilvae]|uniref:BREX-2 system adenine-specific DNA-methyltransferase PglX n=1 Tax=Actinoplanes solisilvae TaxID=2486853 RepID=UPI000FD9BBF4|nr:BREX-2 system adenine-specific DNA-methyltransferase PglX [Actinoplanes solisilvae]
MAVSTGLTAALKKVVLDLEDDLRERVASQPDVAKAWDLEWKSAVGRERTAMSWQEWRDDRVTQAAVAWVLTTVFVRFCEDNRLLKPVWIAGPADRRQEALDAELAYFRAHPEDTDREWVLQAVEYLRKTKATRDLVESHSPLWTVSPSGQAAKKLVAFWRERTADGDLVWDLADPDLSTRFLGDLYQDLSEYAKKTFALLQTPEFVEEFILDQTMEPALAERPLEGFKLIDPTCGSGHFLLGAFKRLNDRWAVHAPGMEVQARVQEALNAIHGVDLNPFAVAIARFRLMLAVIQAADLQSLEQAPAFEFHLAAGDSLLHGRSQLALELPGVEDYDAGLSGFAYSSEDLSALRSILEPGRYDVVVGNPPYITVKDTKLNAAYRDRYPTCKGTYALTVPFMERFFQLAKSAAGDRPAGWSGQITSNSFMKREFGSRLIEEFLSRQDLRLVVDTSGAFIPGHGTPTVILVGRRQTPATDTIKAVLGVRGEPGQPDVPADGLVWREIVLNIGKSEFDGDFVSVAGLQRKVFARHPWSLSGGAAAALSAQIEKSSRASLAARVEAIGRTTHTGNDEAFFVPIESVRVLRLESDVVPVVLGEEVRDYGLTPANVTILPNDEAGIAKGLSFPAMRHLWRTRRSLETQLDFGQTKVERGLRWFDHSMFFPQRFRRPLSIAFASVATHNHFVLDRGGKVFKQSAPVIKLPEGAAEDDHLALLGVLNSSTACFWLKQQSQAKGGADNTSGGGNRWSAEPWVERYDFTGTTLQEFPLPSSLELGRARLLDQLARGVAVKFHATFSTDSVVPTSQRVDEAGAAIGATKARMIAVQEELDWHTYRLYGLMDEDLTFSSENLPELRLGERAFEIALARRVAAGTESTAWFARHGSNPVTEIPTHWPQPYRDLVQRRLNLIEANKFINLLERPENKRRWAAEPWEKQVDKALRSWLLDRLESRSYWFDGQGRPTARSVAQLADMVSRDADTVSVLQLWDGRKDRSVTQQLSALLEIEVEPFLAAYRLKDSGLRKREAWLRTWELQRREDKGEEVKDLPVPPKYTSADFQKHSWWQHRGKLDVPKERFILYPGAGRETDPTQLLGWAGWDHAQQALALNVVIAEREAEGWADDRLVPLVAGLAELQPWVRQWHDETDDTYQLNLADYLDEQLRSRAHQVGMTSEQLGAWKPPPAGRGRRPKA